MQNLQEKYTEEGVIWLSIISSAEGKQGYVSPDEAIELTNARSAKPSHVHFDTSGEVGKMYKAKWGPKHVYKAFFRAMEVVKAHFERLGPQNGKT